MQGAQFSELGAHPLPLAPAVSRKRVSLPYALHALRPSLGDGDGGRLHWGGFVLSYTYAKLELSPSSYHEILSKLHAAGYEDQLHNQDGQLLIDMHGLAVGVSTRPFLTAPQVQRFADQFPNPRIIYDGFGRSKYLSRYYLAGAPWMPDGSSPFDDFGDPREGIVWSSSPVGAFLHRFHRSDVDNELHNHPWRGAVSLMLVGGYSEERRGKDNVVRRRLILPGQLNFIGHDTYHRVDLIDGDAWSLFIVGPKVSSWGFWNRHDGSLTPWREFVNARRTNGVSASEHVRARD